jgi:hypothetical protein
VAQLRFDRSERLARQGVYRSSAGTMLESGEIIEEELVKEADA